MEQKLQDNFQTWANSTLIAYFGTVSIRLSNDSGNQDLLLEHRILGDEIQRRMEA